MGNCFGGDPGPDDNGRSVDPVSNLDLFPRYPFLCQRYRFNADISSIFPNSFLFVCILQEERRRQAAEAAERRQKETDGRGLKDPEGYKRKIEQREQIEREAAKTGGGTDGPLKVILLVAVPPHFRLWRNKQFV